MLSFLSIILAFFFSLTSFFTVMTGGNLGGLVLEYDPASGNVWECEIADEDVAVIVGESTLGALQTFSVEGISEGRTLATATNRNGETLECIFDSVAEINPYSGAVEYYKIILAYDFGSFISYDEGITLTAKNPVDGGYWDFGFSSSAELRTEPVTVNGVCKFDVINTTLEDEKHAVHFTYYAPDGTPLEHEIKVYTLTADGKIVYTPENRLAKIELPSYFSKLISWNPSPASLPPECAEIAAVYYISDKYGSFYLPEEVYSEETLQEIDEMLGMLPVEGTDIFVIEAVKEGTARFTLEKVNMHPIIITDDGYTIKENRYEILETVIVEVTVDSDLNISYEIK